MSACVVCGKAGDIEEKRETHTEDIKEVIIKE